ncbi:MAG: hypothetical protein JWP86_518 [Phenylobacterium sp.]|nr:hypothetical protein [Phenylobacterium sp.]MDB5493181.1 hypothetical protein [Phenylobacterium sp.]
MKILLLGAAAAAMALTGFAASAQPYNGRYGGGYSSRGQDQHQGWNGGARDQRGDYNRGGQGRSWGGDRYAQSNRGNEGRGYSGYARRDSYDRGDNNNGVTTALAGGLIGLVLGSVLSSHSDYSQPAPYGYSQPYGNQSYGYQSYGYQPYGY